MHNELLKGLLKIVGSSGSGTTAVGRSDSQDSRVSYEDPSWGGGNVFYCLPPFVWRTSNYNLCIFAGNHNRHHSISYREWDIPYEEIAIGAKIGSGRFSTGTFVQLTSTNLWCLIEVVGLLLSTTLIYSITSMFLGKRMACFVLHPPWFSRKVRH